MLSYVVCWIKDTAESFFQRSRILRSFITSFALHIENTRLFCLQRVLASRVCNRKKSYKRFRGVEGFQKTLDFLFFLLMLG